MKQTIICKRIGKMLSCIAVMSVVLAMGMLSGCAVSDNPGKDEKSGADLVVIGKIFTSERLRVLAGASEQVRAGELAREWGGLGVLTALNEMSKQRLFKLSAREWGCP